MIGSMRTRATAPLLALLLAACSSGASAPDSPKALADQLGCADSFHTADTEELGVEAAGTCDFSGQEVRLLTFANDDARDGFVQVAQGFGGRYVTGPGYAVEVEGRAAESAVKEAL